jgi:large conductance mechanosensitive channel
MTAYLTEMVPATLICAIGVMIGGAFGEILSSLVSDVLMPPRGLLMGEVDLSRTSPPSLAAAKAAGAPTLNYEVFLQSVFDFLIVALIIFLLVKQVNRFKNEAPPPSAAPDQRGKIVDGNPRSAEKQALSRPIPRRSLPLNLWWVLFGKHPCLCEHRVGK